MRKHISEALLQTALQRVPTAQQFRKEIEAVLLEDADIIQTREQLGEQAEAFQEQLVAVYKKAITPKDPPTYSTAEFDRILHYSRRLTAQTAAALRLVLVDGYTLTEAQKLYGVRYQQQRVARQYMQKTAEQLNIAIPEGFEEVQCLLPTAYAKQVRELSAALQKPNSRKNAREPVFAMLPASLAEQARAFIANLAQQNDE